MQSCSEGENSIIKKCAICKRELTEDVKSEEHVIHNAIGGILKDSGIYCKKCNAHYGSNMDKKFVAIFTPIVRMLGIRLDRDTKGTEYEGILYNENDSKQYRGIYKDRKLIRVFDENGKYISFQKIPKENYINLGIKFELDNLAFKQGMAKIAFNYAVHCGIEAEKLERLFDSEQRKLVEKPIVFPFVPLTIFDKFMEEADDLDLYHALRIFNIETNLFVYIELFSTFQYYVLLSETYEGENIDYQYSNIIEKMDKDEKMRAELMPYDIKDALIIMQQYGICQGCLRRDLRKYSDEYKSAKNPSERFSIMLKRIGNLAYETYRTESYTKEYADIVNHKYDAVKFLEKVEKLMASDEKEKLFKFYSDFFFYTIYEEDKVNLNLYKKFLPGYVPYPFKAMEILAMDPNMVKDHCYKKFAKLQERMKFENTENASKKGHA